MLLRVFALKFQVTSLYCTIVKATDIIIHLDSLHISHTMIDSQAFQLHGSIQKTLWQPCQLDVVEIPEE